MSNITLFCKSYHKDMERAAVMAESVWRFNGDGLPLTICVPTDDLQVFRGRIGTEDVAWLTDDEVIEANSSIDVDACRALPGHISQQLVKAEFWRLNPAPNTLCIDSDSRFIRDFHAGDFISQEGHPYTILHEGKPFLEFCLAHGIREPGLHFEAMSREMRELFGRSGPSWAFNPFPVIWNRQVWEALARQLEAEGSNMLDAIVAHPYESSWYGEAMLRYRPFPLLPREPVFKAYLYLEEYLYDRRHGIDESVLAEHYLGVVYQSNWYPHRLKLHKWLAYRLKRFLQRWR